MTQKLKSDGHKKYEITKHNNRNPSSFEKLFSSECVYIYL